MVKPKYTPVIPPLRNYLSKMRIAGEKGEFKPLIPFSLPKKPIKVEVLAEEVSTVPASSKMKHVEFKNANEV